MGSRKSIQLDVRVLATNKRDLKLTLKKQISRRFILSIECVS
ncbi:hypothetical protein ACT691_01360 [Vibrio metschnikovii]